MSYAPLADFAAELAADPPGPAAGSAAAATEAMAAALTELSARRSGDDLTATRAAASRARAVQLAESDARAYADVLRSRGDARRKALEQASGVLRDIAAAADEVRVLAAPLVETAKGALRGEALAAVELAAAGRRVADQLILVNRDGEAVVAPA